MDFDEECSSVLCDVRTINRIINSNQKKINDLTRINQWLSKVAKELEQQKNGQVVE